MCAMDDPDLVIAATREWIEKAVIGLDLCPFARAVYVREQIRYVVSEAASPDLLLEDLDRELQGLAQADPAKTDTTLLIHPEVFRDFLEYNDFLELAEAAVSDNGLEGVLQVASFHPGYQFEGTTPDDVGNFTNRSPFPTLHLLREESVERAVAAFGDTERIYEKNIETLRRLGAEGWRELGLGGKNT
jgi:hypothetical protein